MSYSSDNELEFANIPISIVIYIDPPHDSHFYGEGCRWACLKRRQFKSILSSLVAMMIEYIFSTHSPHKLIYFQCLSRCLICAVDSTYNVGIFLYVALVGEDVKLSNGYSSLS